MATRLFFVYSVVVFASCQVAEKGPNYGGRGLKIILKPTFKGPPEDILWKHNGSKVMEFDGSEESVYGTYTDRVVLDWHTAELTLKDLRHEDSGHYELEVTVNKMLHTLHHNVEVIDEVDKPSISCVMNDTSEGHASLLCSAEPRGPPSLMTYDWRLPGDESRPGPELPISVRGEDDTVYTCGVRNPVSEKTATFSAKDCFQGESSLPWIIPLIIICSILLVILIVLVSVWYYRKRKQGAEKTNDVESQPSEGKKPTKQQKISRHSRDATLPSNQPLARLAPSGSEEKTDKDQEKEPLLSSETPKGNVLDKVKIYEDLSPTKVARPEDPDQGTVKRTETNQTETEAQASEGSGTNQPFSKSEDPSCDPNPDVNHKQPEPSQSREEANTPEPIEYQDDTEEPAHASDSTEQTSAQIVQMKADDEDMQPSHSTPEENIGLGNGQIPVLLNETPKEKEEQTPTEQNHTTKKTPFPDATQPEDIDSEPKGDAGPDQDTVKPTETEPETESQALEGTHQPVSKPEEPSSDPDPDVNQKQPEPSQEEENTPEPSKDQDDTVEPVHASQHESESTQQTFAQTVQMKADDEEMQPPHSTPEDEAQSPTEQNHTTKKTLFPDVTQPEDVACEPKGDAGLDQGTVKPTETEPETESQALEGTNQPVGKSEDPSCDPNPDVNQKQPEPESQSQEEANAPEPSGDQDDAEEPAHASQHESDSTEQTSAQTAQMKADGEEMQPPHSTPEGHVTDEAQSPTEQNHTTKKTLFPDVTQPEDVASETKGDAGSDQDTVKPTETTEPEIESLALEETNQPVSKSEDPSCGPNPDVNQTQPEPSQSQEEEIITEPSKDQDDAVEPVHASQHERDSTGFEETNASDIVIESDEPIKESNQPPSSLNHGDEIKPHPDHEIEDNYKLDESEGSQTDLYTAGAQEHEAQPGQSREEPCNEKMTGDNEEGEVSQSSCSKRPGQGGDMGAHGDSDTGVETEDVKDISQDVDEQVNAHSVSADVENVNVTGVGHGQEKAERRDEADNEDQIEETEQEAKEKEIGPGNDYVKGESGESEGNNEPDSVSKSVDPKCELDPPPQGPTIPDQPGQNPQHPEPESKMAPEENIPVPSMVQGDTGANTQAITSSLSTKTEDGNIAGDQAKVEMCDKGAEASNREKEAKEKEMEVGQNKGENDKLGEEQHNLTESQEEE